MGYNSGITTMGGRAGGGARGGGGAGVTAQDVLGARLKMAKAYGELQTAKGDRMDVFIGKKGKDYWDRLSAANAKLEGAQAKFLKAQKAYNNKVKQFNKGGKVEGIEFSNLEAW